MNKGKITISIIVLFLSFNLKAQIQVNSGDFFLKGIIKYGVDTSTNFNAGTTGTSKTWDFAAAKKHQTSESKIIPYTETGLGLDANLVQIVDGDTSGYYKKTSSELLMYTVGGPDGMDVMKLKMFKFPFDYQSSLTDSANTSIILAGSDFGLPMFDSIMLTFLTKFTFTADAWGTLKIPSGTYNTLRIKNDYTGKMSAFGKVGVGEYTKIPGFDQIQVSTTYMWIGKGYGDFLATIDTANGILKYFETGTLSTNNDFEGNENKVVAVNPIQNSFDIKNNGNENCEVKITDISGKLILSSKLEKGEEITSDASFLPKGIYFMNVKTEDSNKTYNTKLIK